MASLRSRKSLKGKRWAHCMIRFTNYRSEYVSGKCTVRKIGEEIVSLTKEKHLLDGKISGIQSNFNRLHKLTQAAIQTTKQHQKERIAGERENEDLKQHIQQHKQEIRKYDQQTAGLTEETDQLKLSLEKLMP